MKAYGLGTTVILDISARAEPEGPPRLTTVQLASSIRQLATVLDNNITSQGQVQGTGSAFQRLLAAQEFLFLYFTRGETLSQDVDGIGAAAAGAL